MSDTIQDSRDIVVNIEADANDSQVVVAVSSNVEEQDNITTQQQQEENAVVEQQAEEQQQPQQIVNTEPEQQQEESVVEQQQQQEESVGEQQEESVVVEQQQPQEPQESIITNDVVVEEKQPEQQQQQESVVVEQQPEQQVADVVVEQQQPQQQQEESVVVEQQPQQQQEEQKVEENQSIVVEATTTPAVTQQEEPKQEDVQVQTQTITVDTIEQQKEETPQYKVLESVGQLDRNAQTVDIGNGVRRKSTNADALVYRRFNNVTTMFESTQAAVKKYQNHRMMGYRPIATDGTVGQYKWITYSQANERMKNFSNGLLALGIQPKQHIGIYSKNRPEWQICSEGAGFHSLVTISLYDTLGEESSKYIMNHGEILALVCSGETLPKVLKIAAECTFLKFIISFDPVTEEQQKQLENTQIQLLTLESVEKMGKEKPVTPQPPTAEDLFCIMYTSGTTGMPKGVMLTHQNVVAAMTGVYLNICGSKLEPLNEKDLLISYLPLAHILQRLAECLFFSLGASIGYYQGNVLKLVEDIGVLKPTVMTAVPRVLERIYDKIIAGVNEKSGLQKSLFNRALRVKKTAKSKNGNAKLWDALVFRKTKNLLGGNMRAILSGGAPLRPEVQEMLICTFCCEIVQGYGLTETCAATTIQLPEDYTYGHVGCLLSSVEVKLVSVEDMGYLADAEPPRGEIWIRGPTVSQGYYKDPEKTAEDFGSDGFFRSGDIGEWLPNGVLKIIDRKKNIFKLSQGEYVAAEALEGKYVLSPYLSRVWIYGDSMKSVLVSVAVVDVDAFVRLAEQNKIENATKDNILELVKNEQLKTIVLKDLDRIVVEHKLQGFEKVKNIHLVVDDFEVIDCVTPTQKLQRNKLQKHYQQEIDTMYAALPN
jgi:long-chain acyl-CoA synthetase